MSPDAFGLDASRTYGVAPRLTSSCTNVITFTRYCVAVAESGGAAVTPCSSFSAITGVAHPDEVAACAASASARGTTESGGAGADGVPTSASKCISQYTVCAPARRIAAGIGPPLVATITPGFESSPRNGTVPSAKSNHCGAASGSPQTPAWRAHTRRAEPAHRHDDRDCECSPHRPARG